jgi:proline dehydrogenase
MRNEQGIRCVIAVLGEYSLSEAQADEALQCCLDCIDMIAKYELTASVSVKLSTLGVIFDEDLALANALLLADEARSHEVDFEMDMETLKFVDMTIDAAERIRDVASVTLALQAYLDRTEDDIERLCKDIRVRLVKGAYTGDVEDFDEIEEKFMRDVDLLEEVGLSYSVGTHDPVLIKALEEKASRNLVEFGFLKGLAEDTKLRLVKEGWRVSEYAPFGKNSDAYVARRNNYLSRLGEMGRSPVP